MGTSADGLSGASAPFHRIPTPASLISNDANRAWFLLFRCSPTMCSFTPCENILDPSRGPRLVFHTPGLTSLVKSTRESSSFTKNMAQSCESPPTSLLTTTPTHGRTCMVTSRMELAITAETRSLCAIIGKALLVATAKITPDTDERCHMVSRLSQCSTRNP